MSLRGYVIDFGTLKGQESFVKEHPFVSRTHTLGPAVSLEEEEGNYLRMTDWKTETLTDSWAPVFEARKFLESSWPAVHPALCTLAHDTESRPDLILSDYLVDAVRDINLHYNIPIVMHWPQMPTNMLPASYIPGIPGLQRDILTSEHATIWQRLKAELVALSIVPSFLKYTQWVREMRASARVNGLLPSTSKPNHLVLVNSFFGVEVPKDLPPSVAAVGPILTETYPPFTESLEAFLGAHTRVLYVALGTHVLLHDKALRQILEGVTNAINLGLIDGAIWPIRGMARKQLHQQARAPGSLADKFSIADLLDGAHPDLMFLDYAPQRAVLAHHNTRMFVSHVGASSTNEAVFHGKPIISIAIFFDQLQNAMKLRDAGVSIPLNKSTFRAIDLTSAIAEIVHDRDGKFSQNVRRLQKIAQITCRRKNLAADLIEEVLVDFEGRCGGPERERPMHLQTADARMPIWKAKNYDLHALLAGFSLLALGGLVALPVALRKVLGV